MVKWPGLVVSVKIILLTNKEFKRVWRSNSSDGPDGWSNRGCGHHGDIAGLSDCGQSGQIVDLLDMVKSLKRMEK